MTKKERIAETIATICAALFFLLLLGFFAALFVGSIKGYLEEDVTYRQLKYEELTFERFTGGHRYGFLIYFEEYEEPFQIDSISVDEVDRTALNRLVMAENKVVRVYFRPGHQNDICEMVSSSHMILGLSEYNEAQRDNDRLGIILCALMSLFMLFIAWFLLFPVKFRKRLGELQVEYAADGNVIRVYGSRLVCSLVINDDIVDQRMDSVRGNFVLRGETERDGQVIPVEARFGRANILLFCGEALAARKIIR